MLEAIFHQQHDESRQGEALLLNKPLNSKPLRKLFIESYGCAMNFADSEVVASIMLDMGFGTVANVEEADVIFVNTCSIRENAELKIRKRLTDFRKLKVKNPELIVGVLGCMAERIKSKFLEEEKLVDLVIGPDAYRDLPNLLSKVEDGQKAVNVLLSREETYAEISPVRLGGNKISAYVSITRGCDNMCSFCVVPFTRGRERSRDPRTIQQEISDLRVENYKEIILLGQNVDSYKWANPENELEKVNFAELLKMTAENFPEMRIRFSTSHPKDLTDEVIHTIANHSNICNYIHLPVQSGNTRILELMNRTYTREWYLNRIQTIRSIIPNCAISTDTITGFCSETEEEHQETLSIMEEVKFDFAYMFKYSERPGTMAAKKLIDDVPEEVKARRLNEIILLQQKHQHDKLKSQVGDVQEVLVERKSKKSDKHFSGRNDQNMVVVFPMNSTTKAGDLVKVKISACTSATLMGEIIS